MTAKIQAYSVPQVAKLLGLHRNTVDRLIRRGEIRRVKVGRRVLVRHSALERYLDMNER